MNKRTKQMTIIHAIQDKDVFGSLPAFSSLDTWASWLTWLKAVYSLPMSPDELAIYQKCTGRTQAPTKQPSEIFTVVGRRGGKSFISSLTACFIACFSDFRKYLNAGERAAILILARDRDQAKIVFSYVSGILRAVPPLAAMIEAERSDELELNNDVNILVKTSDFRAIRGLTVAAAILDEVAFWDSEGVSPDREVLTALRPATSTIPGAKLIAISTPYSQAGSLYEAHRDHYGHDDDHVLVWQAESRVMNPTLDQRTIDRELERDPEGAQAEWLATFRTDLTAAFSPESLEACTVKGRSELPASPIIEYQGFVDPSGGKHDSFTFAIAHKGDSGRAIVDLVRGWDSPFNPKDVVREISEALKGYGVLNITGDRFAAEWPIAEFREHGIAYEQCELSKSDLYLAFIPTTNSSGVELPDDKRLLTQLRRLERKRGRLGRDSVDHPPRLFDDLANAVAGVSYLLSTAKTSHAEFNPALHIARQSLKLVAGNWPLFVGVSYDDGISASVIAQTYNNEIRVHAAFLSEGMSLKRHLEENVRPWLSTHNTPSKTINARLSVLGAYERESPEKRKESTLWATIAETFGTEQGTWASISKPWESRRDSMLDTLTKCQVHSFKPVVQLSPVNTALLSQSLNSRIYDREKAEKKTFHVINAFSFMLERLELWKATPKAYKPRVVGGSWMTA